MLDVLFAGRDVGLVEKWRGLVLDWLGWTGEDWWGRVRGGWPEQLQVSCGAELANIDPLIH